MNRLLVVLLAGACTSSSTAPLEAGPKTNGVEGHGGVAMAPLNVPPPRQRDVQRPQLQQPEAQKLDADDLFERGYMLKESSPKEAEQLFELVLKKSPPNSAVYQRAANYLEAMRRP